jgi:hypothetical protein
MKFGIPQLALATAALVFGVSIAVAQTAAPPAGPPAFASPPHKNLKVLPQDISAQQLLGTMKFFAQSLGVRCTYCHVGQEGQPLSSFDFPSDAKEHKNIARGMMRMVAQINANLPTITGESDSKVTCFTCHRGSTTPATMPTASAAPASPTPPAKPERGAA